MPIKLTDGPRVDSRGLPEGYDPHKLYEYRYLKRVKAATGLEGFILQWMPASVIQSLAIAFDPLSQFKLSLGVITPANRLRYRATASVLQYRKSHLYVTTQVESPISNWQNIPGQYGPQELHPPVVNNDNTSVLTTQAVIPDTSNDTTRRTRLFGSDVGEFEKFKSSLSSPSRQTVSTARDSHMYTYFKNNVWPHDSFFITTHRESMEYTPSAAYLTRNTFDGIVTREKAVANALMQKHVLAMYKDTNPQNRNYSLFRNIIELRDMPRSILSLRDSVKHLAQLDASLKHIPTDVRKFVMSLKTSLKDIPNEYLSYHFGWKQTYKDIVDLVAAPTKIGKQINFLLARAGQPTTYRTKRNYASSDSGISGFTYDTYLFHDTLPTIESRVDREVELRMVINTTFRFPDVDVPSLRYDKFATKLGVYPRFIDIYNLMPWTWLVDWFTGLDRYIEVIENINHDPSLINWGFLTASSTGKVTTNFASTTPSSTTFAVDFQPPVTTNTSVRNNHTSVLHFTYQNRKDLSTVLDVNTTADPTSLTSYQQSILGALLSQRSSFKRSRHTGG